MANTYLDSLSDEDLELIEKAVGAEKTLTSGEGDDASALSRLIKKAPAIGKPVTIYRYYDGSSGPEVETGHPLYSFKETAFLFGSTKKLAPKRDAVVFAFGIPSGMPGIVAADGTYLFDKGLTVFFVPDPSGVYNATVAEAFKDGRALTASGTQGRLGTMRLNTGFLPPAGFEDQYQNALEVCDECGELSLSGESIEEFFNRCHGKGGRFCGGAGRGGGGGGGPRNGQQNRGQQGQHGQQNRGQQGQRNRGPDDRGRKPLTKGQKAEQRLQRTANIIRGVTAVVGVVMTVAAVIRAVDDIKDMKNRKVNQADQEVRRQSNLLGLRERQERAGISKAPMFKNDQQGREDKALYDFLKKS